MGVQHEGPSVAPEGAGEWQLIACVQCGAWFRNGLAYHNSAGICGICWIANHNKRFEEEGEHVCGSAG